MDCSVDECSDPGYCKNFCRIHYNRWRKHGDPLYVGKPGRPARTCGIPGCENGQCAKGLCDKHRKRLERYGDPMALKRIRGEGDEARWWFHVDRRDDDECWPWTAFCDENGYGIFWDGERITRAHRWSYRRFVGPIPGGLVPDHTCHDPAECRLGIECPHRRCVNWRHLEPVTNRENSLRGARTKLADRTVAELLVRWRGGTSLIVLAAETGIDKGALLRRLLREENTPTTG